MIVDKKQIGSKFFYVLENAIPMNTNLVVLAGFMPILPRWFCDKWQWKIINTHPSLLPRHGGIGMYGVHVQEAVLADGDLFAGCTVHFVSSEIDGGVIIAQSMIPVYPSESPWDLGGRVFAEEVKLLPSVIEKIMRGRTT